jgi:hypothetical protein
VAGEVRAVWRDNPMTRTWALWLVRPGWTAGTYESAVRDPETGRLDWQVRDAGTVNDDPPLLELDDDLLKLALEAAPGAARPAQAEGRADALAEALAVERGRVDQVLDRLVGYRD